MQKKRVLTFILVIAMAFITAFSVPVSNAAVTAEQRKQIRENLKMANPIELTISELCLGVGDFFMEYLTFLLKEEVTIEKIIFNKVDCLNANFFPSTPNPSTAPATVYVREVINTWYAFLQKITIIIYMMSLVAVGIMILLGGAERKANARQLLMKWTIGIVIFYMFPYLMRYGFDLNQALLDAIANQYYGSSDAAVGSYVGAVSELRYDDIEPRSPEYITRESYALKLGNEEATTAYINRLEDYKSKGDTMRIMRALAGITAKMIYVIIWFIMLWQLCIFIYIYYKRYLMIAFLIAIFPITLVEYMIGNISTGKQSAISSWCKEFFTNVFLQSIHAIIYGIISGVVVNQIVNAVQGEDSYNINWFLMICAVNFVFAGEKILRDIMNAGMTASTKTAGDVSKGARGGLSRARGKVAGVMHDLRRK